MKTKKIPKMASEFKIDKKEWQLVKFGDVADQQKKVVNRDKTNIKRYIKGEHMSSEDLHLRKWGELKDEYLGPAFIRKFEKDDILYGSRRTYLKKVAVADFEGITSNTTFVIKPNQKFINKNLLPYVMLSKGFTEHSIQNSKGSVNPYINWKDIANYEFLLPPKDQQAQLAELLWAMDEVIEKDIELLEKIDNGYNIYVDNLFSIKKSNWNYISLNKIASINDKKLDPKNTDPHYKFKYLDIGSIIEPKVLSELKTMIFLEAPSRARRIISDNSIVLSLVRPYQKSIVFIRQSKNIIASTGTGVVTIKDECIQRFVFHQFFSKKFIQFCENRMTGTNYPAITSKDLSQFTVAIPQKKEIVYQETKKLDYLESSLKILRSKINASKSLQKSLINEVF